MGVQKVCETVKPNWPAQSRTMKNDNQETENEIEKTGNQKNPLIFWFPFSNICGYPNQNVLNTHVVFKKIFIKRTCIDYILDEYLRKVMLYLGK